MEKEVEKNKVYENDLQHANNNDPDFEHVERESENYRKSVSDEEVRENDPNREYNPEDKNQSLRNPLQHFDKERQLPEMDPDRI